METNINSFFHLDKVDHDELLHLLLSYFGNAGRISSDDYTYTYTMRGEPEVILDIKVNKEGKIVHIKPRGKLLQANLDEIRKLIEDRLIDNQNITIGQVICFSVNTKMDGFFKYKDMFQILPIPSEAPGLPYVAGEHPFILQFTFKGSDNASIKFSRRAKRAAMLVRLLNFLSAGRVSYISEMAEFAWVTKIESDNRFTSEWRQIQYIYPGFSGLLATYSFIDKLPEIELAPSLEYYSKGGYTYVSKRDHSLVFPDDIEESLDKIFNLDENSRDKFLRACNWYYQAHKIWKNSISASFVALVSALECLLDKPESCKGCGNPQKDLVGRCETCGEFNYRLNKNFSLLLNKYATFIDDLRLEKGLIYKVRSQLAHGTSLFMRDLDPLNTMNIRYGNEDTLQRNMYLIACAVLHNWLWDKTTG